jgi:16S rRNA (adenine1518-N6/adenine1519-N6)-dimethyltransferase
MMIDSRNQSRKLGQHFLVNKSAIGKIIAALDLERGDTIVEIGPGTGALTMPLAEKCRGLGCKIVAIEKDPELAKELGKNFQFSNTNFQIITDDALKFFLNWKLKIDNWKLVGNIPYYITGKLLRIIGELENKPKLTVLTIQKEVAERIVAKPPKMNLLAAAVQIWADLEIIMNLKPKDFNPPPKVNSAIVQLKPNLSIPGTDSSKYYKVIKMVFKQPRKTLLNNLSAGLNLPKNKILEILKKIGLTGEERPQNLSVEKLIGLSYTITNA